MKSVGTCAAISASTGAAQQAGGEEVLGDRPLRQPMHVRPGHAGLHRRLHGAVRGQHGLVHHPLVGGEAAVHRVGAGHVRRVPVILGAAVVEEEVAVPQDAVVGRALMAVMEDRRSWARTRRCSGRR